MGVHTWGFRVHIGVWGVHPNDCRNATSMGAHRYLRDASRWFQACHSHGWTQLFGRGVHLGDCMWATRMGGHRCLWGEPRWLHTCHSHMCTQVFGGTSGWLQAWHTCGCIHVFWGYTWAIASMSIESQRSSKDSHPSDNKKCEWYNLLAWMHGWVHACIVNPVTIWVYPYGAHLLH